MSELTKHYKALVRSAELMGDMLKAAYLERARQINHPTELELALRHMRTLGDRHMQVAKLHLAKRMTAMYDDLGLER